MVPEAVCQTRVDVSVLSPPSRGEVAQLLRIVCAGTSKIGKRYLQVRFNLLVEGRVESDVTRYKEFEFKEVMLAFVSHLGVVKVVQKTLVHIVLSYGGGTASCG